MQPLLIDIENDTILGFHMETKTAIQNLLSLVVLIVHSGHRRRELNEILRE